MNRIQTAELATKFATCKIETNFNSKLTDPSIHLTFSNDLWLEIFISYTFVGNGNVVELPTKNLTISDISQRLKKLTMKFEESE